MYNERALWRFYSVKCNAGHVSFGGLYKNKQANKQKGSDVDEKNGNSRPPTAVASTRRAGVHSWLCALVCVGEIEKKNRTSSEGGGITACPPGLPAIFVTTETL